MLHLLLSTGDWEEIHSLKHKHKKISKEGKVCVEDKLEKNIEFPDIAEKSLLRHNP